ncbi:MAG: hypothetical protein QOI69_3740 [Pseudonocardiales bacterium]|nr:hypothetical protein [Pseudonocardiales bacterium]
MSAEPFGGSRDALIAGAQRRLGEPGAVLTVVGEPGIGKTTVWSRLLSSAAADWQWATRCLEVEADLGLAVLADFFSAVPDEVALAVPAPQRHARDVVLFRAEERGEGLVGSRLLGATLLGVLRELGGRGTVALGIDDLQWCDPASFEAFSYALHRIGGSPIAVVATRRAQVGRDFPDASQIALDSLHTAEAEQVVRSSVGESVPDGVVGEIAARSGGNPFFARELARQWTEHPADQRLPVSLRELLQDRLKRLDSRTRTVLLDVAVRGAPDVAGFDEDDLRPALVANIAHIEAGKVRFTHPLLASAVIETASRGELRAAHRRAAAAGSDPVAALLHRAHFEVPSEAFAAALDAGVALALARGDPVGARNFAAQALDFTPGGARPAHRLHQLVDLEGATGHFDRVPALGRELLQVAETPAQRAIALICISTELWGDECIALRQQAAAVPGLPERYRQEVFGLLATAMFDVGRMSEAIATLEAALATAADPRSWPDTVENLAYLKRHAGIADDGVLLAEVIDRGRAAEHVTRETAAPVHNAIGTAGCIAVLDDRHDEAAALLAEAERVAARWGEVNQSAYFRAVLSFRTGRLEHAAMQLRETISQDGGSPHGAARLALVYAWRGDTAQATAWIDQAREFAGHPAHRSWSEINFAIGFLALLAGNVADAWHALREAATQLDSIGYREPSHPAVLPVAVEAAAAVGELGEAEALCVRLEREASRLDSRFGLAAARRSRGFLAQARGKPGEAETCFADSAEAFAALHVPLEAGRAYLALGALLRRGGQRRRAREALASARAIFADCGAHGLLRDCDAELGRIGGRVTSTTSQLTESERQVADLVATGMRNIDVARTLHLSAKTVETHLSRTYRKLGVTNRTELSTKLGRDHDAVTS